MSTRTKYGIVALALILVVSFVVVIITVGADGEVEVVKIFDRGNNELPEGITIDKTGNIYVSLGPPGFVGGGLGEIRKISPDGQETLLAKYEFEGVSGPAGLAVDAPGNVYFAFPSNNPEFNGVYQVSGEGVPERIPGTEGMIIPNGLAFDKHGDLYVTDSIMGAIWRIPLKEDAPPEIWFQDLTIGGCENDPLGANGIAYWKDGFYVANPTRGLLVYIPILKDGSHGDPEIVAGEDDCDPDFDELDAMDGIALDVHGNVYALLVLQDKMVRINPADGSFTTLLTAEDGLWNPASIAFGTGKGDRQSVFFTNYAVIPPEPTNSLGAAVLNFDVGEPGLPLP
jgi:sugar lactone lactonase YvrE